MLVNNYLDYALISEEDLLSNIDRHSRMMIPNNDFISDDGEKIDRTPHSGSLKANSPYIIDENALMQKIREQSLLIDNLRNENKDLQTTISQRDE